MYPNTYRCKIIRYFFLDKRIKIGLKSPKQFNFDTLKHTKTRLEGHVQLLSAPKRFILCETKQNTIVYLGT